VIFIRQQVLVKLSRNFTSFGPKDELGILLQLLVIFWLDSFSTLTIEQWIYFYGGLKTNFQPTSEILALDLTTYQWFPLTYSVEKPIPESNRFGHKTIKIGNSILVFGGSTYYQPSSINKTNNPLLMAPKEKKVSMREIFLFDTSKIYWETQRN